MTTERHHREWADEQDRLSRAGMSAFDDGENLQRLAKKHSAEADNPTLIERLERIALMAEIANHCIDDMRVMPAAGVADVIWEAIEALPADQRAKKDTE